MEIAGILAKEASYRSTKKYGERRSLVLGAGSLFKSNALNILLFSFISLMFSLTPGPTPVILGLLGTFELLMSTFYISSAMSLLTSYGLLEPLLRLPVEDSDMKLGTLAVSMYWGGFSLLFFVLPSSALLSVRLGDPKIFFSGVLLAVVVLAFAHGVGFFIGSIAPRAGATGLGRFLSTFSWIAFFLLSYVMYYLPSRLQGLSPGEGLLVIPPFCLAAALSTYSSPLVIASAISFVSLSAGVLLYGAGAFWREISGGISIAPRAAVVRPWRISPRGLIGSMLVKDFRLLSREPRRLASMIWALILPSLMLLVPVVTEAGGHGFVGGLHLLLAVMAGSTGGYASSYSYYADGTGARFLYRLPVARRHLALSKAVLIWLLSLPSGAALGTISAFLFGPKSALFVSFSYLASLVGSSLLASSLLAAFLPHEPASWSEQTFGRERLMIVFLLTFLPMILALPVLIRSQVEPGQIGTPFLSIGLIYLAFGLIAVYLVPKECL